MKTVLAGLVAILVSVSVAYAQNDGLSVTVTPPLFQLTIGPGESWSSELKVVNSNPYDVTYYAQVVDFVAQGEGGQSSFVPLMSPPPGEATSTATLASWIDVPQRSFTVPRGTSGAVPFTIHVPMDATPGGHYAAILIGTEPGSRVVGGPSMRISSMVSTLFFVRIKGEVIESGRIREFRTLDELYQTARADFILRFENTGNSHLRPQGTVSIYNMWGRERGKILLNETGEFGNALPQTTRRYEFSWESDGGVFDIGRYRAEATLTFGQDQKQNTTYATYFWVIPIRPVATTVVLFITLITLITLLIRRYVRRSLALHGVPVDRHNSMPELPRTTFVQFVMKYGGLFIFTGFVMLALFSIWYYFDDVLTQHRDFQVSEIKMNEE